MFMPTTDYNQQLLAYLQTWRQLLEQWTAMTAGLPLPTTPFVMPTAPPAGGPFMPPMPPTAPVSPMPPAPADYTQQLFAYLQAWRQYLEQMTGVRTGSPQASTAQPANAWDDYAEYGGEARPVSPPGEPTSSGDDGSGSTPGSDVIKGSNPTLPPHLVPLAPHSDVGGEAPAPGRFRPPRLSKPADEVQQVLKRPDYDYGYLDDPFRPSPGLASAISPAEASWATPEAPAQHPRRSPFLSAMGRVGPIVSPQVAPRSRFSSRGAQTASARYRETGQTPSR
jgi:hypothetical protein